MPIRNMIKIDEEKCNGCGQCVVDCAEGALAIIDGKAKLVKESYCDGLGACIGNCPTGALTIEQREAPAFEMPADAAHVPTQAVAAHTTVDYGGGCPGSRSFQFNQPTQPAPSHGSGCPGSRSFQFNQQEQAAPAATDSASALTHWPVQLHLINFQAPQYRNSDILIAADCTAFACGAFHPRLLQGKSVAIACPKLDETHGYLEKITDLFQNGNPKSVTVVRMEVPCCRGITQWVLQARNAAGSEMPVEEIILGVDGVIQGRTMY